MTIIETLKAGGPLMYALALIGCIVAVLTIGNIWRLARRALPPGRSGDLRLQALPFWGFIAILVGFLGQVAGHYKMLGVLATASAINPKLVMFGLQQCLVSTIVGLAVCVLALLCWGALRWWQRVNENRAARAS